MYFCPKCHFVFDIGKSINTIEEYDNKQIIKKVSDAIKKVENKEDLTNFKADFKIDDLIKNPKYKKLNQDEINMLSKLFEETSNSGIEFKCTNCNFVKEINDTILLYEFNNNDNNENIKSLEENKLLCQNPILPRTHDYICKNISCPTNKNKIKKEAVFLKENNSFKINYICCICHYNW
jgi:hypothetical protein